MLDLGWWSQNQWPGNHKTFDTLTHDVLKCLSYHTNTDRLG
jgi:hypothetical protein